MAKAANYNSRSASLEVNGVDLTCYIRKLSLLSEDEEVDDATFCEPGARSYGETTWTLEVDAVQSFGDATTPGLHDVLSPLSKARQTFTLKMDKDAASATELKPHFTGICVPPTVPVLDAEIASNSQFTLTFLVIGEPAKVTS